MSSSTSLHPSTAIRGADSAAAPAIGIHTFIVAIRCWWKIAAPIGLLLATGAGAAAYYFIKPQYTATAWVLIRESPPSLLGQVEKGDPTKYVQNQLELLRSPLVLDSVVRVPGLASTPELTRERDPANALRKLLKIRAQGKSEYYLIEFTSVDPQLAAQIVNEVAKTYLELQRQHESRRLELTLEKLQDQQTNQQNLVKDYRNRVSEMSKALTGKDTYGLKTEKNEIQLTNPLADLNQQLLDAEVAHESLKAEVDVETKLLKEEQRLPQAEIDRQVELHSRVQSLKVRVEQNQAKEQEYRGKSANLEKNAVYQQLLKQLKSDEEALVQVRVDVAKSIQDQMGKFSQTARDDQIATMQRDLTRSEFRVQFLRDKLKKEMGNQKQFKGETLELEFLKADHDRTARIAEQISNRIVGIQMEQQSPDRVEIFKQAVPPTSPDEAIQYKKIGLAALLALFLPFCAAVGIEVLHRRVSSREQLEMFGRITVVGELTALPRLASTARNVRRPNRDLQLYEESIDGLRTYLSLVDAHSGFHTVAVTSAISREGKTSLAAQLAVSISKATGESTLLIDGDMRAPDLHQIFDVDRSPGLAEVLNGDCTIENAIETSFSDSLHLITAGSLRCSPHRLFANDAFPKLLEHLKGIYRHIIIDTPPVLPASESLVLARSADCTILCARRDFSRVDQVHEAFSRLQTAGVKIAGAVLGGIPSRDYARRYGAYYFDRQGGTASSA